MKEEEAKLKWPVGFLRLIPRGDRSIHVKIARTIHEAHRQKKNLDGLYKVLAPGSRVGKFSRQLALLSSRKDQKYAFESQILQFSGREMRET